jgi:hypothetical protein
MSTAHARAQHSAQQHLVKANAVIWGLPNTARPSIALMPSIICAVVAISFPAKSS